MRLTFRFFVATCATCLGLLAAARTCLASIVTSDPNLPPDTGWYVAAQPVTYAIPGSPVVLSQIEHVPFAATTVRTSDGNGGELETFNSELLGMASVNGSAATPITLMGSVTVDVFDYSTGQLGTFNTQMTSMDMTGTLAGQSVQITLDPNNVSTGQSSITDIGGGNYVISSYFDVFTELSVGGGTAKPSSGSDPVTLQQVPEPAALIVWAGLGAMGLIAYVWRRRKAKA